MASPHLVKLNSLVLCLAKIVVGRVSGRRTQASGEGLLVSFYLRDEFLVSLGELVPCDWGGSVRPKFGHEKDQLGLRRRTVVDNVKNILTVGGKRGLGISFGS